MSEYHGYVTNLDGSHEPLTKEQASAIWEACERSAEERARLMPTSDDAMRVILDAQQRLNALGWWQGLGFRIGRGSQCAVREYGSTGIWSGWVDDEGKYVHYCDGVSQPRRLWLKPLEDLTEDERTRMAECDASERDFNDRMIQSLIAQDKYEEGQADD